ncbi:MAG TPA: MBL fold metallo-hydrolase [Candidatus Saccharimonadales bacterium]|nr:MBL fold metallo-hydrolase [Candidatus Saccharimonadales bacterium]
MKVTKYEHACVVLEEQGKKLVIDPGGFTSTFGDASNIAAVVVTHVHPDHFDISHLSIILDKNPDAPVFTTQEVAEQLKYPNTKVSKQGISVIVGPFKLDFYGEKHALIHEKLPCPHNTAVLVNDTFYYPGDSFTKLDKPVQLLAVPANAPWAKIAETIDYLAAVKPLQCFPTHNGLLSPAGHAIYNGGISFACETNGIGFTYLKPGESIDC